MKLHKRLFLLPVIAVLVGSMASPTQAGVKILNLQIEGTGFEQYLLVGVLHGEVYQQIWGQKVHVGYYDEVSLFIPDLTTLLPVGAIGVAVFTFNGEGRTDVGSVTAADESVATPINVGDYPLGEAELEVESVGLITSGDGAYTGATGGFISQSYVLLPPLFQTSPFELLSCVCLVIITPN